MTIGTNTIASVATSVGTWFVWIGIGLAIIFAIAFAFAYVRSY